MNKKTENTENQNSPLYKIERKNVFIPPDNYSNTLLSEVQDRIAISNKIKKSSNFEYRLILAAACISIFLITAIQFYNYRPNTNESFSIVSIEKFENEYLNNMDEAEIINDVDSDTFEKVYNQISNTSNLSNEEIEEYILSENSDLSDLSNITNEI